jgi:hypothetical protein
MSETELDDAQQECLLFRREGSSVALRAFRGGYGHGRTEERARIVALVRGSEEAMAHVIGGELDWLGTSDRQVLTLAELVCTAMADRIEGEGGTG